MIIFLLFNIIVKIKEGIALNFTYRFINLADLNLIFYIIKIFFMSIYSSYCFNKIINRKNILIKNLVIYFLSISIISFLCGVIKYYSNTFSYITCLVLSLGIMCSCITKTKLGNSLLIIIICLSLNYILIAISSSITFFVSKIIVIRK